MNAGQIEARTAELRSFLTEDDPVSHARQVIASGLTASLFQVAAALKDHPAAGFLICADTLVIDTATLDVAAGVILARTLDTRGLKGQPLVIPPPNDVKVLQILTQTPTSLTLSVAGQQTVLNLGNPSADVVLCTIHSDCKVTVTSQSEPASVMDLVERPWAFAALKCSMTAASILSISPIEADRRVAQDMLSWVVSCVRGLGPTVAKDLAELGSQAAALLVALNVQSGAIFVPELSKDFYASRMDDLLTVLKGYEDATASLNVQTGIAAALAKAAQTLEACAKDETGPLRVHLDGLSRNEAVQVEQARQLRVQLFSQSTEMEGCYDRLRNAVRDLARQRIIEAAFGICVDVVKLGAAAATIYAGGGGAATGGAAGGAGKGDGAKDAFAALVDGFRQTKNLVDAAQTQDPAAREMVTAASGLVATEMQLAAAVYAASQLAGAARDKALTADLPSTLLAASVDPSLAWDLYTIKAEAMITALKDRAGDGAGDVKAAADDYLASLRMLAAVAKALDAKYVAYSQQLSEEAVVHAQIAAAEAVMQRWKALQADTKSDAEKLAGLRTLLFARADAVKRSVFVAWTYYRASWFYLKLCEPPALLDMDMSSSEMRRAVVGLKDWVAQLLTSTADGKHITLPSGAQNIEFAFAIHRLGDHAAAADSALFTPASSGERASISWAIPPGTEQLRGQLPEGGAVAIWITEAKFYVDGIKPNTKGRVIAAIETSGIYQNGFGPTDSRTFVAKGISGNYAYVYTDGRVYSPWVIDSAIYMTPTPYTQWRLTLDPDGGDASGATRLRVELVVAYMTRPAPAHTLA